MILRVHLVIISLAKGSAERYQHVRKRMVRGLLIDCTYAHLQEDNLQERFRHAAWTLKRLVDGATEVRLVRCNTK